MTDVAPTALPVGGAGDEHAALSQGLCGQFPLEEGALCEDVQVEAQGSSQQSSSQNQSSSGGGG